jgi:hypothetical protein
VEKATAAALGYRKGNNPSGGFLNSRLDAQSRIKASRFFPQSSGLLPSENPEAANGVGQLLAPVWLSAVGLEELYAGASVNAHPSFS